MIWKTVFKYEFLVLFSYPWPAGVIQNSGGLKMDSEVNLQMPTRTLKRPLGMKGWLKGVRGDVKYSGVSICPERLLFRWTSFRPSLFLVVPPPHMGLAKVEACCVNGNDEPNPGKRALLWFNVTGSYITVSSSDQFSLDEICVEASYWRTHQKINIFL